jgi:hypothetical protein
METAQDQQEKQFNPRRGAYLMIPYLKEDGASAQLGLITLYERLIKEGLWEVVFHENPHMTPLEFLNFMSAPRTFLQILTMAEGDTVVDACGMAWLSDVQYCDGGILTKGIGSFVFFQEYQKPAFTDPFRDIVFDYWFNVLGLKTLVGLTPSTNRAASLFSKRMGLREIARIPEYTTFMGQVCDGIVSWLSREEYLAGAMTKQ